MRFAKVLPLVCVLLIVLGCSQQNSGESAASSKDDAGSFMEFLEGKKKIEFQVAYSLKSTEAGKDQISELSQYFKGTKFRMDMLSAGLETRVYSVDGVSSFCSKNKAGEWECIKMNQPSIPASQADAIESSVKQSKDEISISKDASRRIAGADAECYRISSASESSLIRYCFSKEGVPLYVASQSDKGAFEMEAKKYSSAVPDSAFDLPAGAKVLAMPSLPDACEMCKNLPAKNQEACLASCKR